MQCPRCQQDNPSHAKFCLECGVPLGPRDVPALSYEDVQRLLTEATEQQAATAEILRVVSSSPTDLEPVLNAVAEHAARVCGADDAVIFRVDGTTLRRVAHYGSIAPGAPAERPLDHDSVSGRAAFDRRVVHVPDIEADAGNEYPAARTFARQLGIRTHLAAPLLREETAIGVILIRRVDVRPFTSKQITLLETFADQAVIAIENVRLFNETKEALEQQTATGEILRVISRSPTDVQPVFDAIADSALHLCDSSNSVVGRYDGDLLHLAAHAQQTTEAAEALRRTFPLRPSRATASGRAVLEGAVVHIAEVQADHEYAQPLAEVIRARATLAVPMLRDGRPIGTIAVGRLESRPYSDKHIALLKTFADQAVIAIENVRLFKELENSNRDLREALEQQTATSEILRVISSSPTDLQPVMNAMAESAARLCEATDAHVYQTEGDLLRVVASHGALPLARQEVPVSRQTVIGRAVSDRRPIHVEDLAVAFHDEFPEARRMKEMGYRTILATPLLREGEPIGALIIRRTEVRPFSSGQMALLATFADQAVIAIENVRLFTELQEKNRALTQAHAQVTEALEQQTATSEILRVISSSPTDAEPVFEAITQSAMRLCDGTLSVVSRYDGELIHLGAYTHVSAEGVELIRRRFPMQPMRDNLHGRVVLEGGVVHIPDVQADSEFNQAISQALGTRSTLGVPMLLDGRVVGAIAVARPEVHPFTDNQIALLQTFADQAVIAIENVRLFKELEARNRELTQSLEQQTATSEILRVISSSPTDVQPVFDAIVRSAVRLCGALRGNVQRLDGELLHLVATHNWPSEGLELARPRYPRHPDRSLLAGRAVLSRAVVHVPDVLQDAEYSPTVASAHQVRGGLSVPMFREGNVVGAITVGRAAPGPFSEPQIDLLKTFADQAVIAIENVRLFTELQEKNRALTDAHARVTEALEQQTATSEILKAISSSPTDLQPVFDTIARNARRLCGADSGGVVRLDATVLHSEALDNTTAEIAEAMRQAFPHPVNQGTASGRAILTKRPILIPDVLEDPAYEFAGLKRAGLRSVACVPMLRHGAAIGCIVVHTWTTPRPFMDAQVELLKTFADQAVIAIENVRLFKELQTSNRGLTTALEQQTATSELLKVIGRSTFDLQPVFETLAENAVRLCEAGKATIYRFDGQVLRIAVAHNVSLADRALLERNSISPGRHSAAARVALERRIIHIHDIQRDPDYTWVALQTVEEPVRTVLALPMLRANELLGAIVIYRGEVRPFTEGQIALMETFADQAAIAIENVRLFKELETRNKDLTETLEQQTATAEILRVISQSPTDLQPVLDTLVESAARLCEAYDATIFLRGDAERLVLAANNGPIHAGATGAYTLSLNRGTVGGRTVLEARTIHISDLQAEAEEFPEADRNARRLGFHTMLSVPLMREGAAIGAIQLPRTEVRPFTERQVALLQIFADQAVIAIENVRLFKELEARNSDLTEALAQQTATADILRVISSSPTGIQPTFEAIAAAATTLCEADNAALFRFDGDLVHFVAQHGRTPEEVESAKRAFPQPPRRHSVTGRAILGNAVVQIADVSQDPELEELIRIHRTMLSVPLIRDGRSLGAITLARRVVKTFTELQIALLKTFADQAVIAIENVRLFTELQARTQALTRSVEQLTALGEVGQAITSTLDLQTVLSTIVARATQLTGVDAGVIYEYDAERELFEPRATERLEEDIVQMLEATPIRKGQGATGRLAESPEPMQVAELRDVATQTQIPARDVLVRGGYRAVLAVPLVREGDLIGGLTVFRKMPGEFAPEVVDLLRTFATQSALAIQNARLFREIEIKSRQLEAASQHKSEFLANMSHELRTPLNAIIGFSEVLTDRMFGELNEKQEEYLKDIYASGTHLLSLINDILDLSKIEAGRMELELTDFDLPTAIENALMLIRERAGRRSIALHTNIDNRLGQIQADERKVRQIILNLLSNAIKFTPEGGRIDVGAVPKDGFAEVSVTDTGIGIAPEDQEKVFEEFRQVGTAAKKVEGTGLGLTLCRKFVELHGGKIWVKSQLGAGSTFTFTIPVRRRE